MKPTQKLCYDLTHNVSALTFAQTVKAHFDGDTILARRKLRSLLADNLVTASNEWVRARIADAPLAVIVPGSPLPSPEKLAYLAQQRWSEMLYPTLVIRGTIKLAALYGGETRSIITGHLSHEIGLAEVLLFGKRTQNPDFHWTLVHAAPGCGSLPDAISADAAIELIGRYSGETVSAKLGISCTTKLELW